MAEQNPQVPRTQHTIGGAPKATFPIPPPAKPIPGVRGNPPLPGGTPVMVSRPTASERATLEKIGWQEGMPVPSDIAKRLEAMSQEAKAQINDLDHTPLPVPPNTPPLEIPPETDIGTLPPEKQAEIRAMLADAQLQMQQSRGPQMQPSAQGVAEALRMAEQSGSPIVVDDRQQPTYAGTDIPKGQAAGQEMPTTSPLPVITHCPHCNWDLSLVDPVQVTDTDKQGFLQTLLGGLPFQKVYDLLGGQLQLTIRALRPEEVDLCYKQAYIDRSQKLIETDRDYFERMMRYRVCAQLVEVRTAQMIHAFPASFEEWGQVPADDKTNTTMRYIHDAVYGKALRTETLVRLVGATTASFNRLLSKLEAHAAEADFWEATSPAT